MPLRSTSEESFVESKINDLIKNSHVVPEDCYEITTNNYVEDEFYFKAFPNLSSLQLI